MRKKVYSLALAIAAALSGCAPMPTTTSVIQPPKPIVLSAADVEQGTSVQQDDFKKLKTYRGPNLEKGDDILVLRAHESKKGGNITYQIYVRDNYLSLTSWRFYDEAYDSEGNNLKLEKIDSQFHRCTELIGQKYCEYTEHFGMTLTRAYLEKYKGTGISFQVSSKDGSKVVRKISAAYIEGFLAKVDSGRISAAPPAPTEIDTPAITQAAPEEKIVPKKITSNRAQTPTSKKIQAPKPAVIQTSTK